MSMPEPPASLAVAQVVAIGSVFLAVAALRAVEIPPPSPPPRVPVRRLSSRVGAAMAIWMPEKAVMMEMPQATTAAPAAARRKPDGRVRSRGVAEATAPAAEAYLQRLLQIPPVPRGAVAATNASSAAAPRRPMLNTESSGNVALGDPTIPNMPGRVVRLLTRVSASSVFQIPRRRPLRPPAPLERPARTGTHVVLSTVSAPAFSCSARTPVLPHLRSATVRHAPVPSPPVASGVRRVAVRALFRSVRPPPFPASRRPPEIPSLRISPELPRLSRSRRPVSSRSSLRG